MGMDRQTDRRRQCQGQHALPRTKTGRGEPKLAPGFCSPCETYGRAIAACPLFILSQLMLIEKQNAKGFISSHLETYYNFLVILDSDEYVFEELSNKNRFRKSINEIVFEKHQGKKSIFFLPMYDVPTRRFMDVPRLWFRPYEMEYFNDVHALFRNKISGESIGKFNVFLYDDVKKSPRKGIDLIEGLVLAHSAGGCRSQERNRTMRAFEDRAHKSEQARYSHTRHIE